MDMNTSSDPDVQRSWHGWVVFTHLATIGVIAVAVLLSLMALFLL